MNVLEVKNLTVSYNSVLALHDVSVSVRAGTLLAIAGPNGGGKTSFIKAILDLISIQSGIIRVFGASFALNRTKIAYIPQRTTVDWDFPVSVLDVVLMGRYKHIGLFRKPSDVDYMKAFDALHKVGMSALSDRHISELSGGQQQRVFIARALVQEAELLLLDEPFIGIDAATENCIISLLQDMRDVGKTIIVVHHDIQTLWEYFDTVLLLNQKKIAFGPVREICMPEYMCAAYGGKTIFVQKKNESSF